VTLRIHKRTFSSCPNISIFSTLTTTNVPLKKNLNWNLSNNFCCSCLFFHLTSPGSWAHARCFCNLQIKFRYQDYHENVLDVIMVPMFFLRGKEQRKKLTWTRTHACKIKINYFPVMHRVVQIRKVRHMNGRSFGYNVNELLFTKSWHSFDTLVLNYLLSSEICPCNHSNKTNI
jgi:hypothetical protein